MVPLDPHISVKFKLFEETPGKTEKATGIAGDQSQLKLQVIEPGVPIENFAVPFISDLKEIDAKRWEDKKKQFSEGGTPISFRQYVPVSVESSDAGRDGRPVKQLIYIEFHELLKQLHCTEAELKADLARKGDPKEILFKIEIESILKGSSMLSPEMQAMKIEDLVQQIVQFSRNKRDEARLAHLSALFNRQISPFIAQEVEITSKDRFYNTTKEFCQSAPYHSLLKKRMALSGTVRGLREPVKKSESGKLGSKKKVSEAEIALINCQAADEQIMDWAARKKTLEMRHIITLHRILCQDLIIVGGRRGHFRHVGQDVIVKGDPKYEYVPGKFVESEMEVFCGWLAVEMDKCNKNPKEHNPVILAALAAQHLVSIHPFMDGNGRVARMVMDFILLKFNLPPAALRDPQLAVFAGVDDSLNMSQDELVMKVKQGIERTCDHLRKFPGYEKIKSPFAPPVKAPSEQEAKESPTDKT